MDYSVSREYIESFSIEQLESIARIRSSVVLKRFVKIIVRVNDREYDPGVWVYIGSRRDHIVIPKTYCSCKQFIIRVMSEKESPSCIHLLGQILAEERGLYRVVVADLDSYVKIVNEVIDYSRSRVLRKILYSKRDSIYGEEVGGNG